MDFAGTVAGIKLAQIWLKIELNVVQNESKIWYKIDSNLLLLQ